MQQEGLDYKGFVFFGLIKVGEEPLVIEYNCRMGDPETEVVLPRIKSDLAELLTATASGALDLITVEVDTRHACTIVAASGGYPNAFEKGFPIEGLINGLPQNVMVFQAGTAQKDGNIVTAGGRVLCVTALADDLTAAVAAAQQAMHAIHFNGKYYRPDIGYEFVEART